MAKTKTKWICQNCGYETPRPLGKCPDCGSWSSFIEEVEQVNNKTQEIVILDSETAHTINDIELNEEIRFTTGYEEFDRILGGGLVQGSLVLLAGDPGIGKSTLVLQTSQNVCAQGKKLLYVCAEESSSQIKLRAKRLGVQAENLFVYPKTDIESIRHQAEQVSPDVLIIDSIQAVYTQTITSGAGSVSQIRECTNLLLEFAKSRNITVIIVGHVTKEGNIAGPKVLEHMVDTVIYFEGDRYKSYRLLRAIKNRFGSTNEVGVFLMTDSGLVEVTNPNELFLQDRNKECAPGSAVIATSEGTRILLVELQALVGTTSYPSPRRVATGLEYNRLLQILAVLEKRIGLNLSKQDVYVNVIGGIEITEPAADLGIAMAIAACARDIVISPSCAIVGEIALSGEVRAVDNIEKRILEAQKLGFKKIIVPKQSKKSKNNYEIEVIEVSRVSEAIVACVQKTEKAAV